MLSRAIFAADMNMLADMNGRWGVDTAMDIGLGLALRLAFPTRVLIFLPALAMGMCGWAGLGSFAADIATDIGGAMATGGLHGLTVGADLRIADLTAAAIADAAKS